MIKYQPIADRTFSVMGEVFLRHRFAICIRRRLTKYDKWQHVYQFFTLSGLYCTLEYIDHEDEVMTEIYKGSLRKNLPKMKKDIVEYDLSNVIENLYKELSNLNDNLSKDAFIDEFFENYNKEKGVTIQHHDYTIDDLFYYALG